MRLLQTWTVSSKIVYSTRPNNNNEEEERLASRDRDTICSLGVWALRNAVRVRPNVMDDSFLPSFPVPLNLILKQDERYSSDSFKDLKYYKSFKDSFVNTIEKYAEEMSAVKSKLKGSLKSEPLVASDSQPVSVATKDITATLDTVNPLGGDPTDLILLSKSYLSDLNKQSYTNLSYFQLTSYDKI